jgi:hypothetical protein
MDPRQIPSLVEEGKAVAALKRERQERQAAKLAEWGQSLTAAAQRINEPSCVGCEKARASRIRAAQLANDVFTSIAASGEAKLRSDALLAEWGKSLRSAALWIIGPPCASCVGAMVQAANLVHEVLTGISAAGEAKMRTDMSVGSSTDEDAPESSPDRGATAGEPEQTTDTGRASTTRAE